MHPHDYMGVLLFVFSDFTIILKLFDNDRSIDNTIFKFIVSTNF